MTSAVRTRRPSPEGRAATNAKEAAKGFARLHRAALAAGEEAEQVLRDAVRDAVSTVAGSKPGLAKALTEVANAAVKIASERLTPQQQAMQSRAELVASKAVLASAEMTERLGVTRQALSQAVAARRLFALEFRGNDYYPAFFADPEQDKRQLEEVAKALGDLPGWSKWQFFTTPKLPLHGKTPLQALKEGRLQLVLRLAQGFAES
jgi:hypothetical protein